MVPFRTYLRGPANRRTTFPKRTLSTTPSTTTSTVATSTKRLSQFSNRFSRPTGPSRRKYPTKSTTTKTLQSQEVTSPTTIKPNTNIFASTSRRPFLRRPTRPSTTTHLSLVAHPDLKISDELGSSNSSAGIGNSFVHIRINMQNISLVTQTFKPPMEHTQLIDLTEPDDLITTTIVSTTSQPRKSTVTTTRQSPSQFNAYSTLRSSTSPPLPTIRHTIANTSPYQTDFFNKNFNFYHTHQSYSSDPGAVMDQLPAQSKVLLHSNGLIECLDNGNFPHPISCKKFISCAKMENGKMIGWEYTCPKNLSFDPIGGICNWSTDVSCEDS